MNFLKELKVTTQVDSQEFFKTFKLQKQIIKWWFKLSRNQKNKQLIACLISHRYKILKN